jgi:hypothetical protein
MNTKSLAFMAPQSISDFVSLTDVLRFFFTELSRAPFKAGKLPNGGVGLLVHYNNEDILVSAEVCYISL